MTIKESPHVYTELHIHQRGWRVQIGENLGWQRSSCFSVDLTSKDPLKPKHNSSIQPLLWRLVQFSFFWPIQFWKQHTNHLHNLTNTSENKQGLFFLLYPTARWTDFAGIEVTWSSSNAWKWQLSILCLPLTKGFPQKLLCVLCQKWSRKRWVKDFPIVILLQPQLRTLLGR